MMIHRHDGSEIRKQTGAKKMPTAEAASLALTSKILTRVMMSGESTSTVLRDATPCTLVKKKYVCFGRISYLIILR